MRIHTVMTPMDVPALPAENVRAFLEQMASPDSMKVFEKDKDSDFSYQAQGLSRYRVNAHVQRGSAAIASLTPCLTASTAFL